ncbi:cyclin, C-terminal domain-containing protein [Tanacetum coccineum]|uniref:Cyclin, C-terminal domain-containing protein n=1 Tax=Tanacetum coccineum TaxID=301880 RepID=A0ABQ5JDY2_9ASTR
MEESNIPSLVNLQVSEPRIIFESKIIQEMELSVMKKLNWRLLSVTPNDFINYFIFKLPSSCINNEINFHMQCSDLIIKTIQVIEYSRFQSSVIAATTVTIVVGDDVKVPESFYEKVNKVLIIT